MTDAYETPPIQPDRPRLNVDQALKAVTALALSVLAGGVVACAFLLAQIDQSISYIEVGGDGGAQSQAVLADPKLIAELEALNVTLASIDTKQTDRRDYLDRYVAPSRPSPPPY